MELHESNNFHIKSSTTSIQTSNKENIEVSTDCENGSLCGYFGWTPKWLQRFNKPSALLAACCWFLFIQSFVEKGVVYVNLTTWERLFGLSSRQISFIASTTSVGTAVFNLIFGYIGNRVHNGKLLAFCAACQCIGSCVMLLVHVISEPYQLGALPVETCQPQGNSSLKCAGDTGNSRSTALYFALFVVGQIFHAAAAATPYTTVSVYMDAQISPKDTPLYIGTAQSFAALGPACGYVFGGLFLNIYVDIGRTKHSINISSSDPRWAGAWWVGMVVSAWGALSAALILACFPRELPTAKTHRDERKLENYLHHDKPSSHQDNNPIRQIGSNLKFVFTNPVWICLTVLDIFEAGMVIGFAAFMPKIIQHQFRTSNLTANLITGLAIIPAAVIGRVIGGIIPKRFDFKIRGFLILSLFCTVAGLMLSFQFLLKCAQTDVVGVTKPYSSFAELRLDNPCNQGCNCTSQRYDPICGDDRKQYFSPCFAGCKDVELQTCEKKQRYSGCSCIATQNDTSDSATKPNGANHGSCSGTCPQLYIFTMLLLLKCIFTFVADTSAQGAMIRSLDEEFKSFVLGVQAFFRGLLGHMPKLYILGYIFDHACLQWQETCDNDDRACWIYDSAIVAYWLFVVIMVIKVIAIVFYGMSIIFHIRFYENRTAFQSLE